MERLPINRHEVPAVRSRPKRELEHTPGLILADLTICLHDADRPEIRTSGPHHKLSNAVRFGRAVGILWCKSLVIVIVANQDDLRTVRIKQPPDLAHVIAVAVCSRAEN